MGDVTVMFFFSFIILILIIIIIRAISVVIHTDETQRVH